MSSPTALSLNVPQSNTSGTASAVAHLRDLTAQVSGTFSASVQLQGQLSGSTAWVNLGAAVTVASTSFIDLSALAKTISAVRVTVSSYVSGQPVVIVAGH